MCSLCGALGGSPSWEQAAVGGEGERWRSRQQAFTTAAELTKLLAPRVRVRASPDFGFIVTFSTGASEIVSSLGEVWHLLSRRGVTIPDPLALQ